MKNKILKAISHSSLMFAGDNYILLDYSACGNDPKLVCKLILMESLIKKHFDITWCAVYSGICEYQFSTTD